MPAPMTMQSMAIASPLCRALGRGRRVVAVAPHKEIAVELAGGEVLVERGGGSLDGWAAAARAWRLDDHGFVRTDCDAHGLRREKRLLFARALEEAASPRGRAAKDSPGPVGEALALPVEHHGVADGPDDTAKAEPAAVPAGPSGVLDETVALDHERIFELDGLDRQIRGVSDMDLDAVLAVLC